MEIKIPLYDILNKFLTGLVLIGWCAIAYPDYALAVLNSDIIKSVAIGPEIVITACVFAAAYEVGLIIHRLGSVVVEPILKRKEWIEFNDDYALFNEQKKQYPIMNTLSREYALSRTGIALFVIACLVSGLARRWLLAVICIAITFVYFLSCKKHSAKIAKLMKANATKDLKEKSACI